MVICCWVNWKVGETKGGHLVLGELGGHFVLVNWGVGETKGGHLMLGELGSWGD